MPYLLIEYPKCSTCQKAKAWLVKKGVSFETRHIVENPPQAVELDGWQKLSDLPLKRFFNTSGLRYKALNLRDSLPDMSREEQLELLASDGMLVKRPLLIGEGAVLVGFRPAEWEQALDVK